MKRLLLLGGGHAHVQVLRDFGRERPAGVEVVLINRSRLTPYSGMLPGLIAGHYTHGECHIDLDPLCRRADVRLVEQEAVGFDATARCVRLADGSALAYDLAAIDTGSTPPLDPVPGAREHAIPVKPLERFLGSGLLDPKPASNVRSLAVIGAGAAGFEVALALRHRLGPAPAVHVVTDSDTILPAFPMRVQRIGNRLLHAAGIQVHCGVPVTAVSRDGLQLANRHALVADRVVWVTGAAPAPMFRSSGLATDPRGFIEVDASLRSRSHPDVFASGDVATVLQHPRPKAGVFAVRQGPPLTRNLRRVLAGEAAQPFVPQQQFLVLLSAGRRYAIASRGRFVAEGHWVWRWKDWIDRGFMRGFVVAAR